MLGGGGSYGGEVGGNGGGGEGGGEGEQPAVVSWLHDDHEEMRRLQKKMDAARNIGKAVWESTGFGVIPYADPFPTGIDKRTPTGGFFSS